MPAHIKKCYNNAITVMGAEAGESMTSGVSNTLMGYNAGGGIQGSHYNTILGIFTRVIILIVKEIQ